MKLMVIAAFILCLHVNNICAQNAALLEMVKAERDFAAFAKQTSIKQAFLKFMAPNGIKFKNGEAQNAITLFEESSEIEKNDLLAWWPVFADIASSNDFGYTFGTWQYFANKADSLPVSTGIFSSVWQKQSNGEWKNLADLGISFKNKFTRTNEIATSKITLKKKSKKNEIEKERAALIQYETEYINQLNQNTVSFLSNYYSSEGRIHRSNEGPVVGLSAIEQYNDANKKFKFSFHSAELATSADMAYTYGKVIVTIPGGRTINANYIRIWKKEDGKNWKIVLDVTGVS